MLKTIPSRRTSRGCRLRPLRRSRRTKHPVPMTVTVVERGSRVMVSRTRDARTNRRFRPKTTCVALGAENKTLPHVCVVLLNHERGLVGAGDATWTYHASETRESRRHRPRRHQPPPRRGGYPTAPTWSRRTDDWLPRMFTSKILALFSVRAHKTQVASNEDKVSEVAPTCVPRSSRRVHEPACFARDRTRRRA